jgi:4,5-DOPA dioxygenase extradiol
LKELEGKKMDKMPVIFIGHGSPMNAIEDNKFTRKWSEIAAGIPKPEAIMAISAHWYTDGVRIMDEVNPKIIYDMSGFPKELYEVEYKAVGAPELAHFTKSLIDTSITIDNSWGYDHGTWAVLNVMYPNADIPVYQLSVNSRASADAHFAIGKQLKVLRDKGVLIFGSGNVVHNLARVNWDMDGGYDWAYDFDNYIKDKISKREYHQVIEYQKAGKSAELAFTTPDHFFPLLYVLGALNEDDRVLVYNNSCVMGSLSMTSYVFK